MINGMLVRAHASSTITGTDGRAAGIGTPVLTVPAGFPTTEVIYCYFLYLIRISVSVDQRKICDIG